MRAHTATDAKIRFPASFLIVFQISRVGMAFLHALAATNAQILIYW